MAMARREGSFLEWKRTWRRVGCGSRQEGSVKMNEKEGGYFLGFKSRTRRTGLHRPRVASHFFRLLFPPYPSFFSLSSRLPSSPNPSTALCHSCFLAPLFISNPCRCPRQELPKSRGFGRSRFKTPVLLSFFLGRKEWKRIGESTDLANDSARIHSIDVI